LVNGLILCFKTNIPILSLRICIVKKIAIILSLASLIIASTVNVLNLHYLREDGIALRCNETVITADDESYFEPAAYFLETGELKNGMLGEGAYFLRPPGYSVLFIVFGYFFEMATTLQAVKVLQVLLFAASVYCLFLVAFRFLNSKRMAAVITGVYGLTNIASGFLFYTLTEGITPALVIFYIFFMLQAKNEVEANKKYGYYLIAAMVFSFLFVTRPVLGVLGLSIPIFLYEDFWKNKKLFFLQLFFIGAVACSGMLLWQVRNYRIANEFVGLHPIYHPTNSQSCFRPTHQAFWELCKSWGELGAKFHSYTVPFWTAAISGTAGEEDIQQIIESLPAEAVNQLGREAFESMFKNYQASILHQKKYFDQQIPMPKTLPDIEIKTIEQLKDLSRAYRKQFWWQYYVVGPLKVFREMAFHSNLSLYVFQKTFRGHFLMETWRWLCFAIHSLSFLALIAAVFYKMPLHLKSIFYAVLLYVAYLIFVQSGIEERYTLPVLALVLLSAGYVIQSVLGTILRRRAAL
jgi:hypothetical protein